MMMATNLCLNAEQGGEETRDPDGGEVLGGEVPVEAPELVEGEHDAQEVDQDPERVEDVVPVRTLNQECIGFNESENMLTNYLFLLFYFVFQIQI